MAELATELDTYGGAVRHRQLEGDDAADAMKAEFISRTMNVLGAELNPDTVKVVTRNSFYIVMKRKSCFDFVIIQNTAVFSAGP